MAESLNATLAFVNGFKVCMSCSVCEKVVGPEPDKLVVLVSGWLSHAKANPNPDTEYS